MKCSISFGVTALLGVGLLGGCSSGPLATVGAAAGAGPVSEIRAGVLDHDVIGPGPERGGADLSAELLFVKPFTSSDRLLNSLLPRPDIGGTVSFGGRTSAAYAGAAWDYDFTDRIFGEVGFGGSINDGDAGPTASPGHNALGSNILFRESATLGYRISPNWSVMGTIEHMSNAGLAANNAGLTNVGARIGYAF